MGRILAIDYGMKRTGLAVTDPLKIIATSLETVETHKLIDRLTAYLAAESVERIVVGMPVKLDRSDTHTTQPVLGFMEILKKKFPGIPISVEDERFTSKMALQAMIQGGMKKSDRRDKTNVDKISAVIILQSFMTRSGNNL
ncbi:MAG: Holliday junction resolvase RuvX [Cyclobacteriaceae bacterium]|nr:Holliday junction resolvase RuvX [Cyclobacteriaceae bacterium]